MQIRAAVLGALVASASALGAKKKLTLDDNQKVFIENQPILGGGAGAYTYLSRWLKAGLHFRTMEEERGCQVRESCVLNVPVEKAWDFIRPFDFKFMEGVIDSITVEEPDRFTLGQEGSFCRAKYTNGDEERIRIIEMADAKFRVKYEIVSCAAKLAKRVTNMLRLRSITDRKHTFFEFTTDFSQDIPLKNFIENKLKIRAFFSALRRAILLSDENLQWPCPYCTLLNPPKLTTCKACFKKNFNKFQFHIVALHYPTAKSQRQFQSETFELCDQAWRLLIFPNGNQESNYMAAYLQLPHLQEHDSVHAEFMMRVIHPPELALGFLEQKESLHFDSEHTFTPQENDRGFASLLELSRILFFLDEQEELHIQIGVAVVPR